MFFKTTMIAVALMSVATMARADAAAGDACAAKLTADGKLVYAAVVAANPTLQNLRETVESQARGLAMGGKIAMGSARDNATAAGECVRTRLQ
jgi:hypothetical protein